MENAARYPSDERSLARDSAPSTSTAVQGALNLGVALALAPIVWHVVFSPSGMMRLYTPNTGVALVISILMVMHWGMDAFHYWPLSETFLDRSPRLARGSVLLLLAVGTGTFFTLGFYNNLLGRFGPIFFSGPSLLKAGGLGQYALTAAEGAFSAQMMLDTCIIFFTILWLTAFGFAPWQAGGRASRGLALTCAGLVLAMGAFSVLFYPHIAYQFYPAQVFMAAKPWWRAWAMTTSSVFHFGWMVPALVLCYWTTLLWEGRPWSLVSGRTARGVITMAGVTVLGVTFMFAANAAMDWWWGVEAFEGGATIENPAWRWNHVAELAMFMQAAAVMLAFYFGNGPRFARLGARIAFRTAFAVLGGLALAWAYTVCAPLALGTVPGMGQEGETSLCFTIMLIILMTAQQVFFQGVPFRREASPPARDGR